jgi:hypothetical protein
MRVVQLLAAGSLALAGCATQHAGELVSSTEGSTLVRSGQVTQVSELASPGAATPTTVVTIRFAEGDERTYEVAARDAPQVGDRVRLTSNKDGTRISRD